MAFDFEKLGLEGLILIKPKVHFDNRGYFMETYKTSDFSKHGIASNFCQDNHTLSRQNVLRGLHYQVPPKAQGKLVRVIKGRILDVMLDIRKASPTYGKWISLEMSEENKFMLWIPAGFAHGVAFLEDDTELFYKVTEEYSKEHERSILWNDPQLNINWSLTAPILSEKDKTAPSFADLQSPF